MVPDRSEEPTGGCTLIDPLMPVGDTHQRRCDTLTINARYLS